MSAAFGSYGGESFKRRGLSRVEVVAIVFVVCAIAIFMIPLASGSRNVAARRTACLSNLSEIGKGLSAYLADSDDRWPYVAKLRSLSRHDPPWPTLPTVLGNYVTDNDVTDREVFRCPADIRTLSDGSRLAGTFPAETTYFATEGLSFEWQFGEIYGGRKLGEEMMSRPEGFGLGPADQPILRDFELFHEGDDGGSFNTLFADLRARSSRGDRGR
ncbi:MAG: hypothetical protein O7D94_09810 [Planctomycetota bacterium]|nr:hypothetical protein [Planctomycetota bacterium]